MSLKPKQDIYCTSTISSYLKHIVQPLGPISSLNMPGFQLESVCHGHPYERESSAPVGKDVSEPLPLDIEGSGLFLVQSGEETPKPWC